MSFFRMSFAIVFVFLVGLVSTSEADPNYLYHICPNTTTFTANSTYQSNLNSLLSSLSSNSTSNYGFHNTTNGQAPDTVYGLFLCRGDLSTELCQDCVTFGTQDVIQRCPEEKVAVIWYDECLLRYSNRSFFNDLTEGSVIMHNTQNGTNRTSYRNLVLAMVNDVASQAASRAEKYATGATTFPSSSDALYTLAQCTRDLSESNCDRCLKLAITHLVIEAAGSRTLAPSCIVRFEAYAFVNELPPPSPVSIPPLASAKGNF